MTAIVGISCTDGVVIGADSSATFTSGGQFRTIEQQTQKIELIGDYCILAGTGQIGLGQRFAVLVDKGNKAEYFGGKLSAMDVGRKLCQDAIADFSQTGASKGTYGALLAYGIKHEPFLCEFALDDFQPELKTKNLWYVSMGSGQHITDTFLGFIRRVFWKDGPPNVNGGIFAAMWTLQMAIELNPGGINHPISLAVLEKDRTGKLKTRMLGPTDLQEHDQKICEMIDYIGDFSRRDRPETAPDIPTIPK
ncbi:hypothetical protein [Candidatus Nitrospira bockiana]